MMILFRNINHGFLEFIVNVINKVTGPNLAYCVHGHGQWAMMSGSLPSLSLPNHFDG